MTNKEFLKKRFLTNRGCFSEDQIRIEVNDELVCDEKFLTENIVETAMVMALDETTIGKIVDTYRHHPSIIVTKSSYKTK